MKFKIGDEVKIFKCVMDNPDHIGEVGAITEVRKNHTYEVRMKNRIHCVASKVELVLVKEQKVKVLECSEYFHLHIGAIGIFQEHRPNDSFMVRIPNIGTCLAKTIELIEEEIVLNKFQLEVRDYLRFGGSRNEREDILNELIEAGFFSLGTSEVVSQGFIKNYIDTKRGAGGFCDEGLDRARKALFPQEYKVTSFVINIKHKSNVLATDIRSEVTRNVEKLDSVEKARWSNEPFLTQNNSPELITKLIKDSPFEARKC